LSPLHYIALHYIQVRSSSTAETTHPAILSTVCSFKVTGVNAYKGHTLFPISDNSNTIS